MEKFLDAAEFTKQNIKTLAELIKNKLQLKESDIITFAKVDSNQYVAKVKTESRPNHAHSEDTKKILGQILYFTLEQSHKENCGFRQTQVAKIKYNIYRGQVCYIPYIKVEPGFENKGIGSMLIKEVELACTHHNISEISLHSSDRYAPNKYLKNSEQLIEVNKLFYKKNGFQTDQKLFDDSAETFRKSVLKYNIVPIEKTK